MFSWAPRRVNFIDCVASVRSTYGRMRECVETSTERAPNFEPFFSAIHVLQAPVSLVNLGVGATFGESILHDLPRDSTVVTKTTCELLRVEQQDFRLIWEVSNINVSILWNNSRNNTCVLYERRLYCFSVKVPHFQYHSSSFPQLQDVVRIIDHLALAICSLSH